MRCIPTAIAALLAILVAGQATQSAMGQLRLPIPGANQSNLPRLPDDQIEGTIWEYKGELKSKPAKGEKVPELKGRFRTEGKAILDVNRRLALPSKDDVKRVVKSVVEDGKAPEIKLPSEPQVKRLGQYRKLSGGKLRLDLDDKESLNGLMIIWPKKDTDDVWMGTYSEKDGKKTVREWLVELRPIED